MRIVLCHNCWSWVSLDADQCPDCHRPVDLSEPDPAVIELEEFFGPVICRLGRVRCERRKLPFVGELLGVGGGLMFLPHISSLPNGALGSDESPPEPFWQISRWWPLWGGRAAAVSIHPEWIIAPAVENASVAEQFLNAPGAMFVPREQLIRAALRGRVWTISRTLGRTLRLTALDSADEARLAWRTLLSRDPAWRALTTVG